MKLIRVLLGLFIIAGLVFVPMGTAKAYTLTVTTCLAIQNLEGVDAIIDMTFYPQGGGTPVVTSDTILANGLKTLCNLSGLSVGFNGSAVISSNTKLAIVTNLINPTYDGLAASYTGFNQGSTTITFPLLMKTTGYNTQFTVQNTGDTQQALVSIVYNDGQGNVTNDPIAPGSSKTYNQDAEPHASGWVGGAVVTATGSTIAGVALETNNTVLFAYNGMDPATTASTAPIFPIVLANYANYITGMSIQNTSGTASNVTVTYYPTLTGTQCTETHTVSGNSTALFALYAWSSSHTGTNCTVGQAFVGFAKVTANSTNAPLVGVVNELNNSTNKGDSYDGVNPANGTAGLLMPLVMDRNGGYFTGANIINVGTTAIDITCTYTNTTSAAQVYTNVLPNAGVTVPHSNYFTGPGKPATYVGAGTCHAVEHTVTGTPVKMIGIVNQLNSAGFKDTFLVYPAINN